MARSFNFEFESDAFGIYSILQLIVRYFRGVVSFCLRKSRQANTG